MFGVEVKRGSVLIRIKEVEREAGGEFEGSATVDDADVSSTETCSTGVLLPSFIWKGPHLLKPINLDSLFFGIV